MMLMQRWFDEVWNQGREDMIDELLHPEVQAHGIATVEGSPMIGPEAFKAYFRNLRTAFPDIHVTVEDVLVEADRTAARCIVTATHSGEGLGISPTGKPVSFTGMSWARLSDGKIIEAWNNFDFMTMQQQLLQ